MITNVGDTEKAEMSDTTMVAKMMPANTVGEGDTSHKVLRIAKRVVLRFQSNAVIPGF